MTGHHFFNLRLTFFIFVQRPLISLLLTQSGNTAIRVATQWYQNHLAGSSQVLLITNDRENKRKAIEEGLSAETGKIYGMEHASQDDSF